MTKIKLGGQICHKCKQPANTYDKQKWWCGRDLSAHGICKNEKVKD